MADTPTDTGEKPPDSKNLFAEAFDIVHNAIRGKPETDVTLEATFSVEDETEDGDDIVLSGPLFRAGDYPDKGFTLTPAELHDTISTFLGPKPMDLEHRPSMFTDKDLTGAFGQIVGVWGDEGPEDGAWIKAKVRKPKWLHACMPETRVSATFSRGDKSLVGAAWTATPRVEGAELVAAFSAATEAAPSEQNSRVTDALSRAVVEFAAQSIPGPACRHAIGHPGPVGPTGPPGTAGPPGIEFAGKRHDTPSGQSAMQRIHDVTAQAGATCSRTNFASRHENTAIQQAHDLAVTHGATCESTTSGGMTPSYFSTDSGHGTNTQPKGSKSMNLKELLLGVAQDKGVEVEDIDAAFSTASSDDIDEKVKLAMAQKDKEIADLRADQVKHAAKFAEAAEERRQAEAVTFAQSQVSAHKVPPAAVEKLAAIVARIKGTDSTATFSEGDKPTLTLFEEFVEALPDLTLFTKPQLEDPKIAAYFSQTTTDTGTSDKPNSEVVDRILKATPDGRQILAERANSKA